MGRPLHTDPNDIAFAEALLKRATDAREIRMAQAILLPERMKTTFSQTAEMLGVSPRTVPRLRNDLRLLREGAYEGDRRGGRKRENMSLAEEAAFLEGWHSRAESGEIVVASEMRQALANRLGRPVVESYVYRMLARHTWRKVAPDTRHPKADVEKQEAWKKKSPNRWPGFWRAGRPASANPS
jgi:transposase